MWLLLNSATFNRNLKLIYSNTEADQNYVLHHSPTCLWISDVVKSDRCFSLAFGIFCLISAWYYPTKLFKIGIWFTHLLHKTPNHLSITTVNRKHVWFLLYKATCILGFLRMYTLLRSFLFLQYTTAYWPLLNVSRSVLWFSI